MYTKNAKRYRYKGADLTLIEISEQSGILYNTLRYRMAKYGPNNPRTYRLGRIGGRHVK